MLKKYLFIISLTYSFQLFCQTTEFVEYMKKNSISINENDYSKQLDFILEGKKNLPKVLFIGEHHSLSGNEIIYKYFFNQLKQHSKICVLVEEPISLKKYIEDYVFGRDSLSFYKMSLGLRNPTKETMFYEYLREKVLRNELDENDFKVEPIDVEQNYHVTFYRLKQIFNINSNESEELNQFISKLKKIEIPDSIVYISKKEERNYRKLSKELENLLLDNNSDLKKYLNENYNELIDISKSLSIGIKTSPGKNRPSYKEQYIRESGLYSNAVKIIKENSDCLFITQTGAYHVSLQPIFIPEISLREKKTVAWMLNENIDSPVKGKVQAAAIIYTNFEGNKKIFKLLSDNEYDLLEKISTEKLTLYKLNGENTPFKDLSEKIQYLIINKY